MATVTHAAESSSSGSASASSSGAHVSSSSSASGGGNTESSNSESSGSSVSSSSGAQASDGGIVSANSKAGPSGRDDNTIVDSSDNQINTEATVDMIEDTNVKTETQILSEGTEETEATIADDESLADVNKDKIKSDKITDIIEKDANPKNKVENIFDRIVHNGMVQNILKQFYII